MIREFIIEFSVCPLCGSDDARPCPACGEDYCMECTTLTRDGCKHTKFTPPKGDDWNHDKNKAT